MWPETFEFITNMLAAACCAIAVKLADDYLDREYDAMIGKINWAEILDSGTMLYAMVFLALSAGINAPLSLSLFLGSYMVGMFSTLSAKYPSRLNGVQEALIAFAAGIILFGWHYMFFSLCFILAVQLFDDLIDAHNDTSTGQHNLSNRYGKTECALAGLLCTLTAIYLDEQLFISTLFGLVCIYILSFSFAKVKP